MIMMILSVAVVHLSVKSVLARLILHSSDIAIWFLHSILPEHFCACKTSTYKLFVSRCFMRNWYTWDTRYRFFLWRQIEIYTNTTEYKTFSLLLKIHNHLHSSFRCICFSHDYIKKLKTFNLKKWKSYREREKKVIILINLLLYTINCIL